MCPTHSISFLNLSQHYRRLAKRDIVALLVMVVDDLDDGVVVCVDGGPASRAVATSTLPARAQPRAPVAGEPPPAQPQLLCAARRQHH